jgi:hypothetical protein
MNAGRRGTDAQAAVWIDGMPHIAAMTIKPRRFAKR